MIILTVKKADGSTYWVDYFNAAEDAEKWITEEQTRPYWEQDLAPWVHTIVEASPPPADSGA